MRRESLPQKEAENSNLFDSRAFLDNSDFLKCGIFDSENPF